MAITFEIYNKGAWWDLSDYVVSSEEIPYIQRNRDFEAIASIFTMTISQKTERVEIGDKVRIKSGATVIFSGHILKKKRKYKEREWILEIASALYKLRNYKCNYATLHTDLSTQGSDYEDYCPAAGDPEGYPNVGVLFLLNRMFAIAGLTLDTTGIESSVLYHTIFQSVEYDVLMKDIKIDEQALYAINQATVGKFPQHIAPNVELEISFFDFFQKFLSIASLFVHVVSDMSFVLYDATIGEQYEDIPDDDKYGYTIEEITARANGYSFSQNYGWVVGTDFRPSYNESSVTGRSIVTQFKSGGGSEYISWLDNLFYLVRVKPTPALSGATHSAGTVTVTLAVELNGLDSGDYVIIEGVVGMTDLNGQWQVSNVQGEDTFDVILETEQSYISGGTCRFAGAVYVDYSAMASAPFLDKKIREVTNQYNEEIITTAVNVSVQNVVKNLIDIETMTSIITQEEYIAGESD